MFNNPNGLLVIIAVALIGILTVMVIQYNRDQASPGEKIVNSVGEAIEEVGDEIDDRVSN